MLFVSPVSYSNFTIPFDFVSWEADAPQRILASRGARKIIDVIEIGSVGVYVK